MNWDQMKKNLHARVQLNPTAHRLDEYGRKLPIVEDDWLIEEVSGNGVRIKNLRTHHTTTLGKDHIYDYISNPDRSQAGIKHGFLTLKVQIFLKPNGLSITPTVRPGESVEPPAVQIVEKWVSMDHPARSGLKARLEAAGYVVKWASDTRLADLALEGWEIVIEPDAQGVLTLFRSDKVGPHQTLIKRKHGEDQNQKSSFDAFLAKRDQRQSDAEKLASGTSSEWTHLKKLVSNLATTGKIIDGHRFEWLPEPSAELLVLNYSSATFLGPGWKTPPRFRIYIDRRPAGPGKAYVEEKSPVPSVRWNLEPSVEDGEFYWTIRESGWTGTTNDLANGIAKAVVAHYDQYKAMFPRAI